MDPHKIKEIELHRELAFEYGNRYGPLFARSFHSFWNQLLIQELPDDASNLVLDCGCGTGILLPDLAKRYTSFHGLDISIDMISRIDVGNQQPLVAGDAEALPYGDSVFDCVVCRSALHHMPDVPRALRELRRVLKFGGTLVLSEPCNDSPLVRLTRHLIYRKSNKFNEADVAFLSDELRFLVEDAGFAIRAHRWFGYLAYALAGFPDIVPILRFIPGSAHLTKLLLHVDELVADTPFLKTFGLHIIISAQAIR